MTQLVNVISAKLDDKMSYICHNAYSIILAKALDVIGINMSIKPYLGKYYGVLHIILYYAYWWKYYSAILVIIFVLPSPIIEMYQCFNCSSEL